MSTAETRGLYGAYLDAQVSLTEAAEAERAAYEAWQEAFGAYEVARDDAAAAMKAWVSASYR